MNTSEFVFTDAEDKTWDLKLTFAGAKRIDAGDYSGVTDKNVSILKIDEDTVSELTVNAALVISMIYTLKADELKDIGIDDPNDEEAQLKFLERFDGKAISGAKRAFWGALADFHQDQKTGLLKLLKFAEMTQQMADQELESLEGEFKEVLSTEVKRIMSETKTELRKKLGETSFVR